MQNLSQVNKLGIHNGVFHADDVFCAAMATICNPTVEIVRTRDGKLLSTCDLLADIGMGKYDHHQKDRAVRANGIPYCGFGLLWEDFGEEVIRTVLSHYNLGANRHLSEDVVQCIKDKFTQTIVMAIDAQDNGVKLTRSLTEEEAMEIHFSTITSWIGAYNLPEQDPNDFGNFSSALTIAITIMRHIIHGYYIEELNKVNGSSINEVMRSTILVGNTLHKVRHILLNAAGLTSQEITENGTKKILTYFTGETDFPETLIQSVQPKVDALLGYQFSHEKVMNTLYEYPDQNLTIPTADYILQFLDLHTAVHLYEEYVLNKVQHMLYNYECSALVEAAYHEAVTSGKHYIVLPYAMPWKETLLTLDTEQLVWFVLYQAGEDDFRGQGVPISLREIMCLHYYPESWRSLRDEALSKASGIPNAKFCHISGFLCSNTTQEGIIAMTEATISQIDSTTAVNKF